MLVDFHWLYTAIIKVENQMVFQMQIARQQDAVPLVRDYVTDWERANRDIDAQGTQEVKDEGMAA